MNEDAVDAIDFVPPLDATRLRRMSEVQVFSTASARVVFLRYDTLNPLSPQVRDPDGRPLTVNPLKDRRVRKALTDPSGLLVWRSADRAMVTFRDLDDVNAKRARFADVIRQWIEHV